VNIHLQSQKEATNNILKKMNRNRVSCKEGSDKSSDLVELSNGASEACWFIFFFTCPHRYFITSYISVHSIQQRHKGGPHVRSYARMHGAYYVSTCNIRIYIYIYIYVQKSERCILFWSNSKSIISQPVTVSMII